MNEFKIKLMKRTPFLFRKTLKEMAIEYTSAHSRGFETKSIHTDLEDVIGEVCTPEFIEYLEKNFRVHFTINQYSPYHILHNRAVLDSVMKNNPHLIYYIPEEMITPEYIKMFEEFIVNWENFYIQFPIPKIFLGSKIFLDKSLEYALNGGRHYFVDFLNFVIENEEYYTQNEERLLDSIEFGMNGTLFSPSDYNCLDDRIKRNPKLIKKLIEYDINFVDMVPEDCRDMAIELVVEVYKSNKDVRIGRFDIPIDSILYSNKTFIMDYVREQFRKYNDPNNEKSYKSVTILEYALEYISIKVDFSKFKFDEDEMKILIQAFGVLYQNSHGSFPFKNLREFLICFLKIDELVFNYPIEMFEQSLFDDSLIEFILSDTDRFRKFVSVSLFFMYQSNSKFLIALLKKSFVDEKIKETLESYITYFNINAYNDDSITFIIDNFEKINDLFLFKIVGVNNSNTNFLNRLLQKKKNGEISKDLMPFFRVFSKEAYDKTNINLLFKLVSVSEFRQLITDIKIIEDNLEFTGEEEYVTAIKRIENTDSLDVYSYTFISLILQKYKKSGLKSSFMDEKYEEYRKKMSEELFESLNEEDKKLAIDKILTGNRDSFSIPNISRGKEMYYFLNVSDILSVKSREYIDMIPNEMLNKINKKHLSDIYSMLKKKNIDNDWIVILTFNIYLSIGYARARELLNPNVNKSYGPIDQSQLITIFGDINPNSVLLVPEGNTFVPELNEQWINLIFGANSKIKNTLIRNFLNNYEDKINELEALKQRQLDELEKDLRLSMAQKVDRRKQIEDEFSEKKAKYKDELSEFFRNIGQSFNNWDIINEEFLKAQNKSKLKIKLNLSKINEIIKIIKNHDRTPALEQRDMPLLETDIFDYVGYDTQFTENPAQAPARAVDLSRGMEGIFTKKFPNVTIESEDYTIAVYNPQDRDILTAGYKSGCCFRPNGNADNKGKNNSLLTYCTRTTYGGGVKVFDKSGKVIMFSPLLRNGNVLMIHSIETKYIEDSEAMRKVHELLVKFAEEVVRISALEGDPIDFVTVTDLHYLNPNYVKGSLPHDKLFYVYTETNQYKDMYHNLNGIDHKILASRDGITFDDIRYGSVSHEYQYPKNNYYETYSFDNQEIISKVQKMDMLKDKIVILSNKRNELLKVKNSDEAYRLLVEIKRLKKEYMTLYKETLELGHGRDFYSDYKKAMNVLRYVSEKSGIKIPDNIREMSYGNDWYIVITNDGKLIGVALESGLEECSKYFNNLQAYNPNLEVIPINSYGVEDRGVHL